MGKGRRQQKTAGDLAKADGEPEQAGAEGPTKVEHRQAERKQLKAERKRAARVEPARLESRLEAIEEAVATQSERTEELLEKVDAMLGEAPEPRR
jgi:hypothetical protein